MKMLLWLLGLVCLSVAVVYFVVPAQSVPTWMPGFEAGVDRVHVKHAIAAVGAAVVLFGLGMFAGRRG